MRKRKVTNQLREERKRDARSRKKFEFRRKFQKQVENWKKEEVPDYLALQTASKKAPLSEYKGLMRDPDAILLIQRRDGTIMPHKPTQMQLKAEYYRSTGLSKSAAMRKAGYKEGAVKSGAAFTPTLQRYLKLDMQTKLRDKGIDEDKISDKMVQWLDAEKTTIDKDGVEHSSPDTQSQMKAYEHINEIMNFSKTDPGTSPAGTMKRMTFEQYTFGEEEEPK